MKNLTKLIIIILILISSKLYSQSVSDTLFTNNILDSTLYFTSEHHNIYEKLNKSKITTGYLDVYSAYENNLSAYNGQFDTICDINLLKYLNYEHSKMLIDTTKKIKPFEDILITADQYYRNGIMPLIVSLLEYNSFKLNSIEKNLVYIDSNDQLIDNLNSSENPYSKKQLFSTTTYAFSVGMDKLLKLYIGEDLFLGQNKSILNHLKINFNDGNGWQNLQIGINDFYIKEDKEYKVTIEAEVEDLILKSSFYIGNINTLNKYKDIFYKSIEADIPWQGEKSSGVFVYKFGKGNDTKCFKKPFIITDGVDFGYKMDKKYNWEYCRDGKCNSLGFIDIYEGYDHNYEDYKLNKTPIEEFKNGKELFQRLYDEGYDVIFLDYKQGAGYMQRNAMLLIKLIQYINQNKCSNEELIVCGPSMGGQIARYALSYMEKYNLKHCVRNIVYFDSPHKGANIPIGMQLFLHYFGTHNIDSLFTDCIENVNQKLRRIAAQQLLSNHINSIDFNETIYRKEFMNDLVNTLGSFPKEIRQVSIPSGSCSGKAIEMPEGAKIIDMKIPYTIKHMKEILNNGNLISKLAIVLEPDKYYAYRKLTGSGTISGYSYSTPGNINIENRIFYGDAFGLNNKVKHNWDNQKPKYDNSPGGMNNGLKFLNSIIDINKRFDFKAVIAEYDNFTFIPTNSSLCLYNDNLYPKLHNNINSDYPDKTIYPFDAFLSHTTNLKHIEMSNIDVSPVDWIIGELKRTENIIQNLPIQYSYLNLNNIYKTKNISTYNFCTHFRHILNNITINNTGILYINKNDYANYGNIDELNNTSINNFIGETFDLKTSDCGSEVIINNGGSMILGDTNTPVNNKANVRIREGSNVYLNKGSLLKIHGGSTLIIEAGATLNIEDGAIIDLVETNSILVIRGTLIINGTLKHIGKGRIIFDNNNNTLGITGSINSKISIIGNSSENKIEIHGKVSLPNEMNFEIKNATFTAGKNAELILNGGLAAIDAEFKRTSNETDLWEGIKLNKIDNNNHYINNVKIYNANKSLDFSSSQNLSKLTIINSQFYNSNTCIFIDKSGFEISNCVFDNNKVGVFAKNIQRSCIIRSTRFKDLIESLNYSGGNYADLMIDKSTFLSSNIYIDLPTGVFVTLYCCRFKDVDEINLKNIYLNLSSSKNHINCNLTGGYNIFKNSTLYIEKLSNINFVDGYNDFIHSGTYKYFILGNVLYNGSLLNNINNNYINGISNGGNFPNGIPNQTNTGKFSIIETQNNKNIILYGALLNTEIGGCNSNGGNNNSFSTSIKSESTFTLYPNPSSQSITIEFPELVSNSQLFIYDMMGKQVMCKSIVSNSSKSTIDISSLNSGIYTLELLTDGVNNKTKFIKN